MERFRSLEQAHPEKGWQVVGGWKREGTEGSGDVGCVCGSLLSWSEGAEREKERSPERSSGAAGGVFTVRANWREHLLNNIAFPIHFSHQ